MSGTTAPAHPVVLPGYQPPIAPRPASVVSPPVAALAPASAAVTPQPTTWTVADPFVCFIGYMTSDASKVITYASHVKRSAGNLMADTYTVYEVTPDIYAQVRAGGTWTYDPTVKTLTAFATPVDLAALRARVSARIDFDAETVRNRFITPGAGQALVYKMKADEAYRFLAAYATETLAKAASASDWPMMSAEIGVTGASLFAVAGVIKNNYLQWVKTSAAIEDQRLKAKLKARTASAASDITAAYTGITWPS